VGKQLAKNTVNLQIGYTARVQICCVESRLRRRGTAQVHIVIIHNLLFIAYYYYRSTMYMCV